jgi:hypothetical protein
MATAAACVDQAGMESDFVGVFCLHVPVRANYHGHRNDASCAVGPWLLLLLENDHCDQAPISLCNLRLFLRFSVTKATLCRELSSGDGAC